MSRTWKIGYPLASCLLGGLLGSAGAWWAGFRAVDGGTGLLMTLFFAAVGAGAGLAVTDLHVEAMSEARARIEAVLLRDVRNLALWLERTASHVDACGDRIRPNTRADLETVIEQAHTLLRTWDDRASKSTRRLQHLHEEMRATADSIGELVTRLTVEAAID